MTKPKLLVLNLTAQGVQPNEAAALTDAVAQALSERALFDVITAKDVETLVSTDRQKQLLGACDEMSCAADIGEAVKARYVLSGALSRVGTAYELSLQTIDTVKSQPIGRSSRLANDLVTLRELVPYVSSEATGTPLPPPRPRWAQYTMMATGGGLIIGGGVLGMLALSRQAVINEEIRGDQGLLTRAEYQSRGGDIAFQKTLSLVLMGAGAGLAGAGIFLLPAPEGGPRMAFVPSPSGFAVAGVLP
ncbi:MAG: hypothetical protein ACJ790_22765 [Myxococcaceae bacterium]